MSSFSFAELKSLKTIVAFSESADWNNCNLVVKNSTPTLDIRVPFKIAKSFYKDLKQVDDDDDEDYLLTLLLNHKELFVQFPKSLVKQESLRQHQVKDSKYQVIYDTLAKIYVDKMFKDTESLKLNKMKSLVADFDEEATQPQAEEPVQEEEQEEKYGGESNDSNANEAAGEMLNMLESALGSITSLLSNKIKDQMSFTALKSVISSVVKTTLATAGVNDSATELKVMSAISEQGLLPQKIERKGGSISGYLVYTREMRKNEDFKEANKDKKFTDITKILAGMWKALSDEEKKVYNDMAAKEKLENPGGKSTKKGSRKSRSTKSVKDDKPKHTCTFVMTKGENKGNMCGSTIRSEEPTFEGQWLCSKHASAQKKKSKKSDDEKPKKKSKKAEKEEEEVEEEKSEKPKKKKTIKKSEKEEEKPKKKKTTKKSEKEEEKSEKKPKKVSDVTELEEEEEERPKKTEKKIEKESESKPMEDDEAEDMLNEMFADYEEAKLSKGKIKGNISGDNLSSFFGVKGFTDDQYFVKMEAYEKVFELSAKDGEGNDKDIGIIMARKLSKNMQRLQAWIVSKTK